MKEKIKKFTFLSILIILLYSKPIYADVGSFEDYDSGGWDSDWGSSWDSDWDSDYSSGSSSSYDGSLSFIPIFFGGSGNVFAIIIFIIVLSAILKSKNRKNKNYNMNINNIRTKEIYEDNLVINKVKQIDPEFNKDEFERFARDVFVKLQNAWTDRDWEKIRPFEAKELFEQHKAQLEGYIKNNQINVMERICVNWVHFLTFEQYGGNDILKIDLNSRMGDYIIDASTKKVIRGDKSKEYYHTYTLTFIRTTGAKTVPGESDLKTTNCPNCGAPTTVTSSGRCEYCNSVITTDNYGWVLSNLTRKN